MLTATALLKI